MMYRTTCLLFLMMLGLAASGQVNLFKRVSSYGINELPAYSYEYNPAVEGLTKFTTDIMGAGNETYYLNSPLSGNFKVVTASGTPAEYELPLFYRDSSSRSAITITKNAISGRVGGKEISRVAAGSDTYNLVGPDLSGLGEFCMADTLDVVQVPRQYDEVQGSGAKCVEVYIEVDSDIYTEKGGTQGTIDFVTAMFNEVNTLYRNAGVELKLKTIYLWDRASPYVDGNSLSLLNQFGEVRTSFDGNIAQLISYKSSGGIAYVNGLCHPTTKVRMSFANVYPSFSLYPKYSWNIMVMAHEMGHQLGSHHTHACRWNGNNTAIDGCAGGTEGECPVPGYPAGGGTIMSYCHLRSVGINFEKGFGDQPGEVIRKTVAAAGCAGEGCGGPPTPTQRPLIINLIPDYFGSEVSYHVLNEKGVILFSKADILDKTDGQLISDTIMVDPGCYQLVFNDSYGDGICCSYGNGSIRVVVNGAINNVSLTGRQAIFEACVEDKDASQCQPEDLSVASTYGKNQDKGELTIINNNEVKLTGNAWKAVPGKYKVTENTIVTFDIMVGSLGEIHGIGLDDDVTVSDDKTFKIAGTQKWGITDFDGTYPMGQWKTYSLPVGRYMKSKTYDYLFFVSDKDAQPRNNVTSFRNVKIYELGECDAGMLIDLDGYQPE